MKNLKLRKPGKSFVDISYLRDALDANPELRREVERNIKISEAEDDAYLRSLALIRNAVGLTQEELAERLEISQTAVARQEKRGDMLISTLKKYVESLGATISLVVTLPDGRRTELDFEDLSAKLD